jgi:hypothetical protein
MRTIQIGEKQIGLKATPLALLFYQQAFGTDLIGDFTKMEKLQKDPSTFDTVFILKLAWAMAKAHEGVGKKFPDFMNWVAELEEFDISDTDVLNAILNEAMEGFFRRRSRTKAK